VASRDDAGNLYLAVINRNLTNSVEAAVEISGVTLGPASVSVLSGPSPKSINGPALGGTVQANENIHIQSTTWDGTAGQKYRFLPSSISIFNWKGRK
jgi:hypothetical protein